MGALAARCPACGTVFRVVQDQLRVADGWVRCGRCAEVFNAAAHLVDPDSGSPQPAPPAPAPEAPALGAGTEFELHTGTVDAAPAAELDGEEGRADAPGSSLGPEAPPTGVHTHTAAPVDDAEPAPDFAAVPMFELHAVPDAPAAEGAPLPELYAAREAPAETPSFLRQAEQAERWRRPRVRLALASVALLGFLALALQLGYPYRDLAAARVPALRPALEAGCALLGCRIGPALAIDGLAVESSGLVRIEKSAVYRLSVALRNRAGIAVAVPALDLTLNDSQGRVLARRVLRSAELGVNETTVPAGQGLALQATLQTAFEAGAEPVAGYTVELFYP